jgi:hypothetical protein
MCHRDEETALERGLPGVEYYKNAFIHYYGTGAHRPGTTDLVTEFENIPPLPPEMTARMDEMVRRGLGTPEKLRNLVLEQEAAGVDQVIFQVKLGATRHEHVMEALELFAKEVMPEFAARRPADDDAKRDRLALPMKEALARVEAPATDVSGYVIRTDMETYGPPQPAGQQAGA